MERCAYSTVRSRPLWAVIVPLVDKFRASGWLSRVCAGRVGGASPIHSSEQGVLGKLGRRMRCTAPWTRAGVRATHPACSGAGGVVRDWAHIRVVFCM